MREVRRDRTVPVTTRLAQSLGKQRWFARVGRKLVALDVAMQKSSAGRLSLLGVAGMPSLLLTVTGRRSGLPRPVPLLYVPAGDEFLVVGSNWGQRHHPAWSANLLAHPEAIAQVGGSEVRVRARMVSGDERDRLWRTVVRAWPAYATYAQRAGGRELRLFVLTPIS
jgi:deazaflavin-dependent oxidoreductase (nitroreductase family)